MVISLAVSSIKSIQLQTCLIISLVHNQISYPIDLARQGRPVADLPEAVVPGIKINSRLVLRHSENSDNEANI